MNLSELNQVLTDSLLEAGMHLDPVPELNSAIALKFVSDRMFMASMDLALNMYSANPMAFDEEISTGEIYDLATDPFDWAGV